MWGIGIKNQEKHDILQTKTEDKIEYENGTKQTVNLQAETESVKNYEAGDKQTDPHQAKPKGTKYQAKAKGGVKNEGIGIKNHNFLQAKTKGISVKDYEKQNDSLQAKTGGEKQNDFRQAEAEGIGVKNHNFLQADTKGIGVKNQEKQTESLQVNLQAETMSIKK